MKKLILSLLLIVGIGASALAQEPAKKACKLTVAETISANGEDDAYVTTSCDVESFSLAIYNRMGDQIFKTTDVKEFWDFNKKNDATSKFVYEQGVYKYMVTYKFADEPRAKSKAGSITLIR